MTIEQGWGTVRPSELKTGDTLQVDDNFTCIPSRSIVEVKCDKMNGFYLDCDHGKHFLTGQIGGDGFLIGIRRPQP